MKKIGLLFALLLSVLCLSAAPAWARPTVVIDAGHGGHDRGGVPGDRYPEKVYTLDVSRRLEARLRQMGYRTVMTRRGDYFVPLNDRCYIANSQRNAIFVSVHFNSAPREGADGVETYYYGRRSGSFAAAVHRQVVRAAGTENRGVRQRGFYVIRNTRVPAILVECGFLTNRAEGRRIAGSGAHRQRLADAIAIGIRSRY